jgi:2-polyprenyl-6-methoxyphenol hydroxylase-like FAD-dependent oxidoreductase
MTASPPDHGEPVDVVVVGTGFAGSLIALKAADLGLTVRAVDALPTYPDRFRAEKLEQDQYEGLERLGAVHLVRPEVSPFLNEVTVFQGGRSRVVPCTNHRGMDYQCTVNRLREDVKARLPLDIGKVVAVRDVGSGCEIDIDDGSTITARLGVIASGGGQFMRKALDLDAPAADAAISTTFGFFVEPEGTRGFPSTAFNVIPDTFYPGLQYITFFPVGQRIRVNLFTCWSPTSDEVKAFRSDPIVELKRHFPMLDAEVGAFRIEGQLQVFSTRYYRHDRCKLRNAVLIGDDYQSVSPATGMGISKCVTDVRILTEMLVEARETPSLDLDPDAFYHHPEKLRIDEIARRAWEWENDAATSQSLRTRIRGGVRHVRAILGRAGAGRLKRRLLAISRPARARDRGGATVRGQARE